MKGTSRLSGNAGMEPHADGPRKPEQEDLLKRHAVFEDGDFAEAVDFGLRLLLTIGNG